MIELALLESIFDKMVDEWECHGFARDVNDLPSQFAFEFARRTCARVNEWTDALPATEGLYWYLQADGDTGYVELCRAGPLSEQPDDLIVSETTEPLWSIIRNWGITRWCGPLVPPAPY